MARLPKRARNNFFFSKKEKVEEVNRPELLAWVQASEKSVPYVEGQQYLVHLPDRRGRWVWYYVTYPTERSFDEASESTVPVRLIREENPWVLVNMNMRAVRHPEELSLVILDAKTRTVAGPVPWSEVKSKRNPKKEKTTNVDIAYAIRRTQANILGLRDGLIEQRERMYQAGIPDKEIHERVWSSPDGRKLSYEFRVLRQLQQTEALRRAFGPKREHEEVRANPDDESDEARVIQKQRALVRRLEQQLKEKAALLELQGLRLHQIRAVLLDDALTERIKEERAILDRLRDWSRLSRVFQHSRGTIPVAEANPAPLIGVAAQIATSVVLNMGIEAWGKLTEMSVAERAAWLEEAARKASWLSGIGGFVYQHAPVGKARKKIWLEISKAMTSPEVTSAVRTAAVTSAVGRTR